jgi:20S proteasome subunit beta 1
MCVRQPLAIGGSGSTYVYGYVDAHFKTGMARKECLELVTNSMYHVPYILMYGRN